nr:DNA photolyase family protein [Tanacetum cinerariifolium]
NWNDVSNNFYADGLDHKSAEGVSQCTGLNDEYESVAVDGLISLQSQDFVDSPQVKVNDNDNEEACHFDYCLSTQQVREVMNHFFHTPSVQVQDDVNVNTVVKDEIVKDDVNVDSLVKEDIEKDDEASEEDDDVLDKLSLNQGLCKVSSSESCVLGQNSVFCIYFCHFWVCRFNTAYPIDRYGALKLICCLKEWNIKRLCFEYDTDPYYQALDARVKNYASENGIEIFSPVSHTLFNPAHIIEKNGGKPPMNCQLILKLWNIKRLCFEYDTDPYYQALDARVKNYASENGIEIFSPVSHTLFNPAHIIEKNGGKPPMNCQLILKLVGEP